MRMKRSIMKFAKYNINKKCANLFLFKFSFQLKVVSEISTKQTINTVAFEDLALTDFYVIIADDFENVRTFQLP